MSQWVRSQVPATRGFARESANVHDDSRSSKNKKELVSQNMIFFKNGFFFYIGCTGADGCSRKGCADGCLLALTAAPERDALTAAYWR